MNAFKIGFIGLGLIGGSVAKSIHRIFPNYTIIGYDVNTATLKEALPGSTNKAFFFTSDNLSAY